MSEAATWSAQAQAPDEPYEVYHRDRRVPWITRWSAEVVSLRSDQLHAGIAFPDEGEPFFSIDIEGDADGDLAVREGPVLWYPERNDLQGQGVPQWRQVSSHRQRLAMREMRCQVCAMPTERTVQVAHRPAEAFYRWFGPWSALRVLDKNDPSTLVTSSPPVCESCVPVAKAMCPHIREEGWLSVIPTGIEIYAVDGYICRYSDGYARFEETEQWLRIEPDGSLPRDTSVLAKQLVVTLTDCTRSPDTEVRNVRGNP